jgi:hypothetical protein
VRPLKFVEAKPFMVLPPAADRCQVCATKHEAHLPHNAQSLYYQMTFNMQHGRGPTWLDAMAHCSEELRKAWTAELKSKGVDVDAGKITPKKDRPDAR